MHARTAAGRVSGSSGQRREQRRTPRAQLRRGLRPPRSWLCRRGIHGSVVRSTSRTRTRCPRSQPPCMPTFSKPSLPVYVTRCVITTRAHEQFWSFKVNRTWNFEHLFVKNVWKSMLARV